MKHVDKPSPGDSKKFLEHKAHIKQKEKQSKENQSFLFIIIIFALGGLYGLLIDEDFNDFGSYPVTEFDVKHYESERNHHDIASEDINSTTSNNNKTTPKSVLSIDGQLETYEDIKFLVKGFDSSALYVLDYGDGKEVELGGKEVFYQYSRSGFFTIKLYVETNGIKYLLFSEVLDIAEAPEIVSTGREREG